MRIFRVAVVAAGCLVCGARTSPGKTVASFSGESHLPGARHEFLVDFSPGERGAPAALPGDGAAIRGQGNTVAFKLAKVSDSSYQISIKVNHLKTSFFDLLSDIEGTVAVDKAEAGRPVVKGNFASQYSLLDYQPVKEMTGNFEVVDRQMRLKSLSFGGMHCRGTVDLAEPFRIDLALSFSQIDLGKFLEFWVQNSYEAEGSVTGEIQASGTLDQLALKGNLESFDGKILDLDYNSITLNVTGVYPNLQVKHSTISRNDGVSFSIDGPFNLHDPKFHKQMETLTFSPLVSDSGVQSEWTIRRYRREDESSKVELKYLRKKDEIGKALAQDSDMLGIERTVEF